MTDLVKHLGGISIDRIRMHPLPGTATYKDIEQATEQWRRCELVDGVLVEKPMGWYESAIAAWIVTAMVNFLKGHNLGKALCPDASLRILADRVRLPDSCFISWKRFPSHPLPRRPVPELVPDLAVEVLSESNTAAEMNRKLEEYFRAGVTLVWYIDSTTRSARVYTGVDQITTVDQHGFLDGGDVLPGLSISLAEVFAYADQQGPNRSES